MLCIDMAKLATVIIWTLTISNFIVIIILICLAKGWNKTADKVFSNRSFGNYNFNEIDSLIEARNEIIVRLEELEKKRR